MWLIGEKRIAFAVIHNPFRVLDLWPPRAKKTSTTALELPGKPAPRRAMWP